MITQARGVTELLAGWRDGDEQAGEAVFGLVYDELRALARRHLRREAPGHTLVPTALVHEVCARLIGQQPEQINDRRHLIGIASRLMRQVLVNYARDKRAAKRGGDWKRIGLESAVALFEARCVDLPALDEALARLQRIDRRQCDIVELRFFGGLTVEQTAAYLGTSTRSVEREWTMARAWLRRELGAS